MLLNVCSLCWMDCATEAMYDKRFGLTGSGGSHELFVRKGLGCESVESLK